MLPVGLMLVLGTFSAPVIGTIRYANVGDRVELACLYTKGDLTPGDIIQWEKEGGGSADWDVITVFQHVKNPWRDHYLATFSTSAGDNVALSIRVMATSQAGTYRCQLLKNDQEIELALVQIVVFGGDVLGIDLLESDPGGLLIAKANPSPISFNVMAFNDVKDFITVQAGEKDLTSGMRCNVSVEPAGSKIVNTTCSTDTSAINQGDDGVLLTITVVLPTYRKAHSLDVPIFVLVPPTIDCQKTTFALKGTPATLSCHLRSRGGQFAVVWQLNQTTLMSLNSTPSVEQTAAHIAQVNRQGQDRGDGAIATLTILAVEDSSYGVYTIIATNEAGSSMADLELKVAEAKPNVAKDVRTSRGASALSGKAISAWLLVAPSAVALAYSAGNA